MKTKSAVILWGFVQLGLGFAIKYLSGIYDLKPLYFWIGVVNVVVWFFIGLASYRMIKDKSFDRLILSALAANLIGIVAFLLFFFGMFKNTSVHVFSQHYFLPMRSLTAEILHENTLSMLTLNMDKVFLLALLLQFAAYGVGYLLAKK